MEAAATTELQPAVKLDENLTTAAAQPAALPKGVKGTMDGEKPLTQLQEMQKALEPYQKRYGHYLSKIRPWREFLWLRKPNNDMRQRLEANLTIYQINYAVIFLILMIASIIMNPQCLVVICVLVIVWMSFLKKNDDPNWMVEIGGIQLGKTQRWLALSGITAIVLLCVVGQIFFSAAFFCCVIIVVHGIMHPLPEGSEPAAAAAGDEVI
eukprot:gnl/TRDRNA2_/TRDRNA2_186608_c0_seq1.p1 gnl/TRDRNA2_/TRDRNA2_186608_c0~~gnl/TRDRNA2_/TRDRNA2_186608_c0_seq1.p1  ORF type:complete len:231 (-),score=58.53 gnl/TRDRNA2_/TRDRNA2_186608_c0_seq1:367-996(-)